MAPYRVLDLTDDKGSLCGRILGDLGADVIKIEPPGGDPTRNLGPFYQDIPHPEKSLSWFAFNFNKRGITLDITSVNGRQIFEKLVKGADFVIESFPPGYLEELGLGYKQLSQINGRIVVTSITPFGQSGPYRDYKGPDIVGLALGGYLYLTGDPDRPPVRITFPQSYLMASGDAAVGTLVAHYHRELTGEGQHVDVSMQQSVVWMMMNARPFWDLTGTYLKRAGSYRTGLGSGALQRQTWPCKDGYVSFAIFGGRQFAHLNKALVAWLDSEGMADDFIKAIDWDTLDMMAPDQEFHNRISEPIIRFFLSRTKEELYQGAIRHGVMLYPANTAQDLFKSQQLQARDFWDEVEHPELNVSMVYPGAFAKISEAPCKIRCRAPLIGEHNQEIYGTELGFSLEELAMLKAEGII